MFIFGLFGCCLAVACVKFGAIGAWRAMAGGGLRDREAAHVIVKSSGKRNWPSPKACVYLLAASPWPVAHCPCMEMWRRSSVEGGGMSWWRCNIVIVTVTN